MGTDKTLQKKSPNVSSAPSLEECSSGYSIKVLNLLLPRISALLAIGLCILLPTCIPTISALAIAACFFFGFLFVFSVQSIITIVTLHSVDINYRPNAIAFQKFMSHMLGDVPAPIIVGFVKDYLSPSCIFDTDGDFVNERGCKRQRNGLIITLGLCYSMFALSIIFFKMAHWLPWKDMKVMKQSKELERNSETDDSSTSNDSFSDLSKEL